MSRPVAAETPTRTPLSRERVLRAAVAVADEGGITSLTIRSLAQQLGVKPMSVYHHVANKDEILDGIVDIVFSEIELPAPDDDWRTGMARRAHSARQVLKGHRWAIGLLETRTSPGPATLHHHDRILDTLLNAGFSLELTAHAYAMIDSYVYGFALQEAGLPFDGPDTVADIARPIMERFATGEYPRMVQMATEYYFRPGYDFGAEFEFGLSLILDGLTTRLAAEN